MRVGIRICGWSYKDAIPLAKRVGFTDLEPEWSLALSTTWPDMARMAKDNGILLSAVLTGMDPMSLDDFRVAFEDCNRIEAKSFTAHPHPLDLGDEEGQRRFQEHYGAALELGRKRGVKLAVHSCGLGPEQWDLMFRLVPGLSLKYDPSFSNQAGGNYVAEIFKYGPRIVHAHAKDEVFFGRITDYSQGIIPMTYMPAGMGTIQWGSVVGALYEVGFDDQIAIEYHSKYWSPGSPGFERGLIVAKRHLEQFIV